MSRTKHVTKTTPDTKAEIIENSVQNVSTKPVLTATELKKQFVKPVVNEDGTPCAISELDRIVDETEAALNEVYGYYEDKTSETQAHAAAAESYALQAEQSKTAASESKAGAAIQALNAQTYASQAKSSASAAFHSEAKAEESASFAASYESGARVYNQGAQIANSEAKAAATAAKTSETNAAASEAEAKTSAQRAETAAAETETLYHFRGSVQTYQDLPTNAVQGDTYNVIEAYGDFGAGTNFAWNGATWDSLGGIFDTTALAKLSGNNTFTGNNAFMGTDMKIGGMFFTLKATISANILTQLYISNFPVMGGVKVPKDDLHGTNDLVYFQKKAGMVALTSDIPTDCATQGQLAQTNQNVEDLYTILEQAQVVTVTTLEQAYTTRETADGENIVDGVQTAVKEIRGKTVATENLIPYPYTETTKTMAGLTYTDNGGGSITVNGTPTDYSDFLLAARLELAGVFTLSGIPVGSNLTYTIGFRKSDGVKIDSKTGVNITFNTTDYSDYDYMVINIKRNNNNIAVNNVIVRPMLNAGTEAKPYNKWFAGLKNASFEKIVSTGKNLIPYPYYNKSGVINGITYTVNSDGSILVNGTATANSSFILVSNISPIRLDKSKKYVLSGCPAGGGFESYRIFIQNTTYQQGYSDVGNGVPFTAEYTDYYIFIIIGEGVTVNNLVFRPMLNHGASALPYEPYISDTLSVATPIELPEYDVAYPETGETKRQSKTMIFNGTENWTANTNYTAFSLDLPSKGIAFTSICSPYRSPKITAWNQLKDYEAQNGELVLLIKDSTYSTVDEWKAHLAELAAAGNPLTITYKTAEATSETTPFNKSKYIAWKNGSETIEQGTEDNSEYGAENTVKQDYFTLTGGTTNV